MGWRKARSAAWREFGRRYWRVVIGLEIARRSAPVLLAVSTVAAIAAGMWWLVTHTPEIPTPRVQALDVPGRWWWWLFGLLTVVAMWRIARRRNPYSAPTPGRLRTRLAAGLAVIAAAIVVLLWRNA